MLNVLEKYLFFAQQAHTTLYFQQERTLYQAKKNTKNLLGAYSYLPHHDDFHCCNPMASHTRNTLARTIHSSPSLTHLMQWLHYLVWSDLGHCLRYSFRFLPFHFCYNIIIMIGWNGNSVIKIIITNQPPDIFRSKNILLIFWSAFL